MSIYVEARVHGRLEDLWEKTQNPNLHERWDARFTSITYLPRDDDSQPQRFRYSTRIGFGLSIDGEGESIGQRNGQNGKRTSSLRFWSNDPRSLIREGAGYWQYTPATDNQGIRFITGYDYQTRFGTVGKFADRIAFRPLMGWATAWSFDRLRLWIEKDIDPSISMRRTMIHAICRVTIALVWIYQGLVPKIIARHADELTMLTDAGIPEENASQVVIGIGLVEIMFGLVVLVTFRKRWPLIITILLMILATFGVAVASPAYLVAAFNPISLNLLLASLAVIGLIIMNDLPSARRCLRRRPEAA